MWTYSYVRVVELIEDTTNSKNLERTEIFVCKRCGNAAILSKIPFERQKKHMRQFSLDDNVLFALKRYCVPYGSINNGLSMLLYQVQKLESEQPT